VQIRKTFAYGHSGKSGSVSALPLKQLLSKRCRSVFQSMWQRPYSWEKWRQKFWVYL